MSDQREPYYQQKVREAFKDGRVDVDVLMEAAKLFVVAQSDVEMSLIL